MRKFLTKVLACSIVFLYSTEIQAQCTPDNSETEFGAYSSAGKNKLPAAWLDSAFDETVTIVVPEKIQGFTITKVTLNGAPRLYNGLSYQCNPSNCIYNGGSNGCIKITGKATDENQVNQGTIDLDLNVVTDIVTFDTILAIEFNLLDSASLSTPENLEQKLSVFPNPASSVLNISLPKNSSAFHTVQLVDMSSKVVAHLPVKANDRVIKLPLENLNNGLYLLRLYGDHRVHYSKVTVEH